MYALDATLSKPEMLYGDKICSGNRNSVLSGSCRTELVFCGLLKCSAKNPAFPPNHPSPISSHCITVRRFSLFSATIVSLHSLHVIASTTPDSPLFISLSLPLNGRHLSVSSSKNKQIK